LPAFVTFTTFGDLVPFVGTISFVRLRSPTASRLRLLHFRTGLFLRSPFRSAVVPRFRFACLCVFVHLLFLLRCCLVPVLFFLSWFFHAFSFRVDFRCLFSFAFFGYRSFVVLYVRSSFCSVWLFTLHRLPVFAFVCVCSFDCSLLLFVVLRSSVVVRYSLVSLRVYVVLPFASGGSHAPRVYTTFTLPRRLLRFTVVVLCLVFVPFVVLVYTRSAVITAHVRSRLRVLRLLVALRLFSTAFVHSGSILVFRYRSPLRSVFTRSRLRLVRLRLRSCCCVRSFFTFVYVPTFALLVVFGCLRLRSVLHCCCLPFIYGCLRLFVLFISLILRCVLAYHSGSLVHHRVYVAIGCFVHFCVVRSRLVYLLHRVVVTYGAHRVSTYTVHLHLPHAHHCVTLRYGSACCLIWFGLFPVRFPHYRLPFIMRLTTGRLRGCCVTCLRFYCHLPVAVLLHVCYYGFTVHAVSAGRFQLRSPPLPLVTLFYHAFLGLLPFVLPATYPAYARLFVPFTAFAFCTGSRSFLLLRLPFGFAFATAPRSPFLFLRSHGLVVTWFFFRLRLFHRSRSLRFGYEHRHIAYVYCGLFGSTFAVRYVLRFYVYAYTPFRSPVSFMFTLRLRLRSFVCCSRSLCSRSTTAFWFVRRFGRLFTFFICSFTLGCFVRSRLLDRSRLRLYVRCVRSRSFVRWLFCSFYVRLRSSVWFARCVDSRLYTVFAFFRSCYSFSVRSAVIRLRSLRSFVPTYVLVAPTCRCCCPTVTFLFRSSLVRSRSRVRFFCVRSFCVPVWLLPFWITYADFTFAFGCCCSPSPFLCHISFLVLFRSTPATYVCWLYLVPARFGSFAFCTFCSSHTFLSCATYVRSACSFFGCWLIPSLFVRSFSGLLLRLFSPLHCSFLVLRWLAVHRSVCLPSRCVYLFDLFTVVLVHTCIWLPVVVL